MTTPASNGQAAFDLDAAVARASAKDRPFAFTFKGAEYVVPPSAAWPVEVMDLIGAGDMSAGLGLLLGDDQWGQLRDAGITVGAINVLFDQVAKAAGLTGQGNSRQGRSSRQPARQNALTQM